MLSCIFFQLNSGKLKNVELSNDELTNIELTNVEISKVKLSSDDFLVENCDFPVEKYDFLCTTM